MLGPSYSSQILMKHEFSRQIFEKYSNIIFHENSANGSLIVPCGETDRNDEANNRFSQFCESAQKPKETTLYFVASEHLVSQLGRF